MPLHFYKIVRIAIVILRRFLIYSTLFFILILLVSILGGSLFEDKILAPYFSAILTVLAILGLGTYADLGKKLVSWTENTFFRSRRGLRFFFVIYAVLAALFLVIVSCTVTKYHYRKLLSLLVPSPSQEAAALFSTSAAERIRYLATNYPDRDDWKIVLDAVSNALRPNDAQYREFNRFVIESVFSVPDAKTHPVAAFDFSKLPPPKWYCLCNVAKSKFSSFELFVLKFAAQGLADSVNREIQVTQNLLSSAQEDAEVRIYSAILQLGGRMDELANAIDQRTATDPFLKLERGKASAAKLKEIIETYSIGVLSDSDVYLLAQDFLAQFEIYSCHLRQDGAEVRMFTAYEELLRARLREIDRQGTGPIWFYEPQKFILYTFVSNVRARSLQHKTDETFDYYNGLCSGIDAVLERLQSAFPTFWGNDYDKNWRIGTVVEKPLSQTVEQVLNTLVYQGWRMN